MGATRKRTPNLRLMEMRLNRGLSPQQLAYYTGVSAPTIRLAERGHTPNPRIQFALADFFGLQVLDLWPLERQKELA